MKKNFLIAFLLFWAAGYASFTAAQVTQAWVNRINGPVNGSDHGHDVAVDPSGNIYTTGWIEVTAGSPDYYTVKFSPDGDTLWTRRYGGPANGMDYGYAIAVDDAGNAYVTGQSVQSGGLFDLVTIKYNTNGDQLWINVWSGPTNFSSYGYSVAVDVNGNVYVTGFTSDGLTSGEFVTVKYNSAGVEQWSQRYKGPGTSIDYGNCIVVDDAGNSYVAGWSGGENNLHDMTTIKYSPDGDSLWVRRYNGSANDNDYAYWVALDPSGNVIVTGQSVETGSDNDITTIKYSSDGDQLWIRHYDGPGNAYDAGQAVAVDADGNAYVTGNHSVSPGVLDCVTLKYSSTGDLLWAESYNGPGNGGDVLITIALDDSANAYVSGFVANGGASDIATLKYSTDGVLEWTELYNGPGNSYDGSYAIAVDHNYGVYVAAYSTGSGTDYDYTVIKYSQPVVPVELTNFSASEANGNVILTWSTASETNNDRFEIERSVKTPDPAEYDWALIGAVDGNGTTTETHNYSFTDSDVSGSYIYRLKQCDYDGSYAYSKTVEILTGLTPKEYSLSQNYPNPFNPSTMISYSLPAGGFVSLKVYDLLGSEVASLVNREQQQGNYTVNFDASKLSTGMYMYKLQVNNFTSIKKMLLIR